jgi:hypothetical protein
VAGTCSRSLRLRRARARARCQLARRQERAATSHGDNADRAAQEAAVIGVILLVVLLAYGGVPSGPGAARRGLGMAAATAFCLVLILGRPFDEASNLTQWPADERHAGELARRDDARPNPDAGLELAGFWFGLLGLRPALAERPSRRSVKRSPPATPRATPSRSRMPTWGLRGQKQGRRRRGARRRWTER